MLMGDRSRNKCFFYVRISHVLHFISICDFLTDSFVLTIIEIVLKKIEHILVCVPHLYCFC
jgi:hypothetical protein